MRILAALIILISLTIPAFAQFGNETITITTYYPSPYGVYRNLRLFPSNQPADGTPGIEPGVIYFDSGNDTLLIYVNETAKWQPAAGGGLQYGGSTSQYGDGVVVYNETDSQYYVFNATNNVFKQIAAGPGSGGFTPDPSGMLVNAAHTQGDCTAAGGEVVASDVGFPQCRFNSSVCPSGWTRYKSFETTIPRTCVYSPPSCRCHNVTTSSHAWADGKFFFCRFCIPTACGPMDDPRNWYDVEMSIFQTWNCCGSTCGGGSCEAITTQIGCY